MSRVKHILSYAIPIAVLLFFLFGSLFAPHDPTATNIRGNSDEFISALSEFKTCNDETRLRELFELLINTDLDQVLDVPLTHQMDMIVYNTDKIADYNFASDYAYLPPIRK